MAGVDCPFPGCTYSTPEGQETIMAVALLNAHTLVHSRSEPCAKPDKVKRPEMSSDGTTEGWTYFLTRWAAYIKATRLSGSDLVIQLLECCDD